MLLWILITCAFIPLEDTFALDITFCTTFKCPDLSEHNIKCRFFENNIDCLRSMNRNEVQLGYATAYEAVAAKELLPNIEVLADVKDWSNSSQWLYEVVVVTNKPVANFEELKDCTYCNYGVGDSIPKYVIDGLERAILKGYSSPSCGNTLTFEEEQVCKLKEFFGPSCRAGGWINNLRTETEAKKWAYLKLCQLCPDDKCELGYPPHKCLQVEGGAVAIVPLHVASTWNSSFYYLCQNGSTSTKPCAWHQQAWPLLFTHKSWKQRIAPKLNEMVTLCAFGDAAKCLYPLGEILTSSDHPYISVLNETEGLIPTLQPYKLDSRKNKPIRWCTITRVEYDKCNWLKVFSGTLIYPIECILRNSTLFCIASIEQSEADMMEIVAWPTRNTHIIPIALSTTPHSLYTERDSGTYSKCRDKFYFEGSVLRLQSEVQPSCPYGLKFRTVCTKRNNECYYHSEVIMRRNDTNRENAKTLLSDLLTYFSENSKKRPFNFFESFNGVPNLLLQSDSTDFYFLKFKEQFNPNYNTESTPRFIQPDNQSKPISSGVITFLIILMVVITMVIVYCILHCVLVRRSRNQRRRDVSCYAEFDGCFDCDGCCNCDCDCDCDSD